MITVKHSALEPLPIQLSVGDYADDQCVHTAAQAPASDSTNR